MNQFWLLALRALEADAYDVVLMECRMPEMDGYEATRRLRAAPASFKSPAVPVIALTANAFTTDRDRCIPAGMNDFLSKPLDPVRLEQSLVRTFLKNDSPLDHGVRPPAHDCRQTGDISPAHSLSG